MKGTLLLSEGIVRSAVEAAFVLSLVARLKGRPPSGSRGAGFDPSLTPEVA
jgi:hypothetical protein